MSISLQPVRIGTGYDEDGLLVLADDYLVAVLVRLTDRHGEEAGKWFLETGYGRLSRRQQRIFADIDAAQGYIADRLQN